MVCQQADEIHILRILRGTVKEGFNQIHINAFFSILDKIILPM